MVVVINTMRVFIENTLLSRQTAENRARRFSVSIKGTGHKMATFSTSLLLPAAEPVPMARKHNDQFDEPFIKNNVLCNLDLKHLLKKVSRVMPPHPAPG